MFVTIAKLEVSTMLSRMLLALLWTRKLRARFLPRELICIVSRLNILRTEMASRNVWWKWPEKEGSQREKNLDSTETPAYWCFTVRTNEQEPVLLELAPYDFMVQ
jgi:hypothetical protein